ncbi:ligase-associated DNA damage response endonuclease PdeM [Mongoliitalea daihaiensis]|nr:ligase-associated DNA damage response endonuclease PdeM [Mongoliitalea daihaiensis]
MQTYTWEGIDFQLLPEKALFIPEDKCLLLADTHFGKAAHFRKAGIPIPESLHQEDLLIIEKLLNTWRPSHVYFLGDLFHSDLNESWFALEDFLDQFPETCFTLIKGNHDILPPAIYQSTRWEIVPEKLELGKLVLTHEPMKDVPLTKFNLCGHIHPGIRLHGNGRQRISLPCFFISPNQLILPAFGRFTGLHILPCTKNNQAYVVTGKKVVEANLKA